MSTGGFELGSSSLPFPTISKTVGETVKPVGFQPGVG